MGRITITDLQVKVVELETVLNQHRSREEELRASCQTTLREKQEAHEKEVEALKKQIESEKQSYRWANERASQAQEEINSTHTLIDAIDCPLPRKSKNPDGYGETENSLTLRIASWLAKKAGMGAA